MMLKQSSLFLLTSLLAVVPASADGLYTKNSPVLQVNQKNYDKLIARSNYASIVEFYAPWCGHCQSLKPAYEKAAKNLDGLANVAAVNCDDDDNKPLCSQLGVQGFPTLKIMTPSKKPGKPRTEDYKGPRSAKGIAEAVVDRIPNHVKKLTDKDAEEWLSKGMDTPKAILFTEKGTTSALIRALAIEFLGSVDVAQIRSKETNSVDKFGITDFPTIVLLPGSDKEPIIYEGELKKAPIVQFISQVATPNVDPSPKKSSKASPAAARSSVELEDQDQPTGSPDPKVVADDAKESKPAQVPSNAHPIATLSTVADLESACLTSKSKTCLLALLPEPKEPDSELPEPAQTAVTSLSDIAHKHSVRKTKLFPFYTVPAVNEGSKTLRAGLGLPQDGEAVEIIALNGRRGWWRRYDPSEKAEFGVNSVESWIDSIRLGEGAREKLPQGVVVSKEDTEKAADHDEL